MIQVKTYLPVFPGFYCTIFEPDETIEIEHINSERSAIGLDPVEWCDIEFNYQDYFDSISESCCEWIENECPFIESVKFERVSSPKEYNFRNDSIHCEIIFDEQNLMEYIYDNMEEFKGYIHDNYTSRSGFISRYPNKVSEWLDGAIDHEHKVGSMLQFYFEGIEDAQYNMYEFAIVDNYLTAANYEEL